MFLPVCSLEADLRESDVTGNVEGIDAMERPQAVVELREVLVINRNFKCSMFRQDHDVKVCVRLEREVGSSPVLITPASTDARVTDDLVRVSCQLHSDVKVERNVLPGHGAAL